MYVICEYCIYVSVPKLLCKIIGIRLGSKILGSNVSQSPRRVYMSLAH